jgi:Cu2+-exporting ATPase
VIEIYLVHAIPGRCRLRLSGLGDDAALRRAVAACLDEHPLIDAFRINVQCDSLVVEHHARGTRRIVQLLLDLDPEAWPEADVEAPEKEVAPSGSSEVERALLWSCGALALSLVAPGPLALASVVISGIPILKRTTRVLLVERRFNVDFLDALALSICVLRADPLTAAVMTLLVNLGDVIRDRTARRSKRQLRSLLDFQSVQARVLAEDGSSRIVKAQELEAGLKVQVLAGDVVPADGTVRRGAAAVDQRSITGESVPATRQSGDTVYAGTSVVDGSLVFEVTQAGAETTAARIVKMIESAPIGETRIQNYAEKFADRLVPPLLAANVGMFALTRNVDRFLAMSIVDFGTGIRVAAPTAILSSMTQAAHEGILIKGGRQVEQLAKLHTVAFDKTGTLTLGRLSILDVQPFSGLPQRRLVELAAAAEAQVRHPVAQALVAHAIEVHALTLPNCEAVDFRIGMGVSGLVGGLRVHVGNERYFRQEHIAIGRAASSLNAAYARGAGALLVAVDETLVGAIYYADALRPESARVITELKRRRIGEIVMLTGDRGGLAHSIAAVLGIARVFAEVLPADKAEIVRTLRGQGAPIAMVGDGVNDSPALAQADVGIALVEGADIARDTADVVLMEADLTRMVRAIDISRQAMRLVHQNYNLIAICNAAALALSIPTGLVSPFVATVLSNGSALLATLNGMRPLLARRPAGGPGRSHSG